MQYYVKHATLISNCYPEKEGENIPRASELSYLISYATSKPAKLTKIGSFLEKRIERDITKSRKQNNLVSLEILKALIEACHRDLNFISKNVVKIVDMMLDTRDMEIVDLACQVFVIFTSYYDGSTLGVDNDFTKDYESLLKKFSDFCSFGNADQLLELQIKYTGQRALLAAVTSNALQASNFKNQLNIVLLSIVHTLSKSKFAITELAKQSDEVNVHRSAIGDEDVDEFSVEVLAAKSFIILFSKATGSSVKISVDPLFNIIDLQQKWWPSNFVVSLMELAIEALQPKFRYMLVSEILDKIHKTDTNSQLEKYASLTAILDFMLNSTSLVGITVLEVLNTIYSLLIKSVVQFNEFRIIKPPVYDTQGTLRYTVQFGLAHSIGGLATQTYYMNQLNDITGYIISKLRIGQENLSTIEGLHIEDYRHVTLNCLDLVFLASSKAKKTDETYNSKLALDIWVPSLALLLDKSPDTRVNFALTIVHYVEATTAENNFASDRFARHLLDQPDDIVLVNSIHKTILDWIQLPNFGVQDINLVLKLLSALVVKYGVDEVVKAVPLIFKIQQLVKQLVVKQSSRQRAVAALVIEWFAMVATVFQTHPLGQYIGQIRNERIRLREYSPAFLSNQDAETFEELEPNNTSPVDKFLDPKFVVEVLCQADVFRDEQDPEALGLENKLMLEWGSDAYVDLDRAFTAKVRNRGDMKMKLSIPWSNPELNRNDPGKKPTVKVETLKEVLAGQATSQQANSIASLTAQSISKRPNESVVDVNYLLQSLSLEGDPLNSSMIVNPPYK